MNSHAKICTVLLPVVLGVCLHASPPARSASQILLSGSIAAKCTITVSAMPDAANLILDDGVQHVLVGNVLQDCNGRRGYVLEVMSTNCLAPPLGAKLLTSGSSEGASYSVEAHNPTNGGSVPVVTGLLLSGCTGQVARDVTHALIKNETTSLYVNYTGVSGLEAGIYQDVLTISITTK